MIEINLNLEFLVKIFILGSPETKKRFKQIQYERVYVSTCSAKTAKPNFHKIRINSVFWDNNAMHKKDFEINMCVENPL